MQWICTTKDCSVYLFTKCFVYEDNEANIVGMYVTVDLFTTLGRGRVGSLGDGSPQGV